MSPLDTTPSKGNSSPTMVSPRGSKAKIRKRVRKACDRCRIKKTKCDGSSPCLRCQTDNIICCAKQSHRLRHRKFPQGYAQMLERQQGQLVSCIQQLYQRLRTAGLWEQPLPGNSGGQPLTHDILAALDLLGAKDDGSGELEIFHDAARSPQSDYDIMPSLFDGNTIIRDRHEIASSPQSDDDTTPPALGDDTDTRDRHDSMMEQSKSPNLIGEYTVSPMLGTAGLENHTKVSTRSLSPQGASLELSPEYPKQCATQISVMQSPSSQARTEHNRPQQPLVNLDAVPVHRSVHNQPCVFNRNTQSPWSQTHIEHNASQTQLPASLAAAPIHRSAYNPPNAFNRDTGTTPLLSLDTGAIGQDYSSDRIIVGTSMHFPFWHAWARSGIMIDISDFSTDFHMLSPLDPSRHHGHFHGVL